MVHIYTTSKTINQLAIGYMINPLLKFNNAFITQVENGLSDYFLSGQWKQLKILW